ncbi:hypothetical protein CB1_001525014 [Camelus ferus]|nr:hypothetical protein CB1_001525014 [Camelus ferus]
MSRAQISALVFGVGGFGALVAATASNEWKVTTRASSVITATWVYQGLWMNCAEPFHAPRLDAWTLLPPRGGFQYSMLSLEVSYTCVQCSFTTIFSLSPKVWFDGWNILGTLHDEQLGSIFRSCSFTGKLRELAQCWDQKLPVLWV